MDGKGRATDNAWIERFWRSSKGNYVYLNPSDYGVELYKGINNYINYYHSKKHQSLNSTPEKIYAESINRKVA